MATRTSEFSDQFAGGGVDDADVEILDEEQDVGSPRADVVEAAVVAEGDHADGVDPIAAKTRS